MEGCEQCGAAPRSASAVPAHGAILERKPAGRGCRVSLRAAEGILASPHGSSKGAVSERHRTVARPARTLCFIATPGLRASFTPNFPAFSVSARRPKTSSPGARRMLTKHPTSRTGNKPRLRTICAAAVIRTLTGRLRSSLPFRRILHPVTHLRRVAGWLREVYYHQGKLAL